VNGWTSIVRLDGHFDDRLFTCGDVAMDTWVHYSAQGLNDRDLCRVHVCLDDEDDVVGFYTLTNWVVEGVKLPNNYGGATQVPALLLGHLGVATKHQRRGVGREIVLEALDHALRIREESGVRLLVVDAKNDVAAGLYKSLGFKSHASNPRTFYVKLKLVADARARDALEDAKTLNPLLAE